MPPPHDSSSVGDPARFLPLDDLRQALTALPPAPTDEGRLTGIVRRVEGGVREQLRQTPLTRDAGVPGDAWSRDRARDPVAQITVMEHDVAALIANGQSEELFGDQLFVQLDLSVGSLPVGSRLRIGSAVLEVTPQPHNGCRKFRARFGGDALTLVSMKALRHRNLRGVYMTVVEDGEAAVGDAVTVLSRPGA
jgi:MOSC domain-containing protein YiiM